MNRLGSRTCTGKRWQHPRQIIKLLRWFGGGHQPFDRRPQKMTSPPSKSEGAKASASFVVGLIGNLPFFL